MCRAVAQAEIKTPNASWIKSLPWHSVKEASAATVTPSPTLDAAADGSGGYFFGFLDEFMLAYRIKQGSSAQEKVAANQNQQ